MFVAAGGAAFDGDCRSSHFKILPHSDKRQLSGVAFALIEGHSGVSIAIKLRHPPGGNTESRNPENKDHESPRGLARAAPPVRNASMAAEPQKKGSLM